MDISKTYIISSGLQYTSHIGLVDFFYIGIQISLYLSKPY